MHPDIDETRDYLERLQAETRRVEARVARSGSDIDNGSMESVPRPELDAKLEAIEARLEGRVARIEDAVRAVAEGVKDIRAENRETQSKIAGLKMTMITTAIATVIAIVLGIAGFNATLTSNMFSAFQTGLQLHQPATSAPTKPGQ